MGLFPAAVFISAFSQANIEQSGREELLSRWFSLLR
jgi:hypothetical protein